MTQIFLLAHSTVLANATGSFPDPGNWNPINKVECVGCGGWGAAMVDMGIEWPGAGGGGGSYAVRDNVRPKFPVPYRASSAALTGVYRGATNFNRDTHVAFHQIADISVPAARPPDPIIDANVVSAPDGGNAHGSPTSLPGGGGGVSWPPSIWPTGFAGGSGGSPFTNGPGGGGAGGPNGAGSNGANSSSTAFGGGGSADGGTVPGQPANGGAGFSGTHWGLFGIGGGGAGSQGWGVAAGAGGRYGGGGGGGGLGAGGAAGWGLIVITYTPLVRRAKKTTRAIVMA